MKHRSGFYTAFNDFYSTLFKKYEIEANSLEDLYELNDTIKTLEANNESLKNDLSYKDKDKLIDIVNKNYYNYFIYPDFKAKLLLHTMFHDIRIHSEKAIKEAGYQVKFASFHVIESQMLVLSKLFFENDFMNIPFASSLLFELYNSSSENRIKARVIWNNKVIKEYEYNDFIHFLESNSYNTNKKLMERCTSQYLVVNKKLYMIVSIIMMLIFGLIWGGSWYLVTAKDNKKEEKSLKIIEEDKMDISNEDLSEIGNINASVISH